MTDAQPPARPATTWIFAGSLLIAIGVLQAVSGLIRGSSEIQDERTAQVLDLVVALLVLTAYAAYAFGFRRAESIVARRPVGMTALLGAGVAEVAFSLWWMSPSGYGAGVGAGVLGFFVTLVIWVFTVTAAVSIARARVLPSPWNAVPLAAIAVAVVLVTIIRILLPSLGIVLDPRGPLVAVALSPALVPIALGIASIVLGIRHQPTTVAHAMSTTHRMPSDSR